MSSGLIYAVIVGLWAVVLVPVWLRRHDEALESRSVDRFQGAMRTLSRRGPGRASSGDQRELLVPRVRATRALPDGATQQLTAAARAAARRRRTGLLLTLITVVVAVLGALGRVPWWWALVPLAVLALFGLQVRLSARRARARDLAARRARAARARRARQRQAAEALASQPAARTVARSEDALFDQTALAEPVAVPVAPAAPAATAAVAEPAEFYDAVAERVWEPVPVPLPTYVLAPKANRSVRVIDLTRPGAWTSGHLPDGTLPDDVDGHGAGAEPTYRPVAMDERDGIVTGEVLVERRAVGD